MEKGEIAVRKVSIIILFVLLMLLTATAQADGDWVCSECGRTVAGVLEAGDYCPYCDAHRHTWIPASCTEPERCSCGKTKGEPLGHEWEEATCTEPKTCARCGVTEGEPLGHHWIDATYSAPKTCSACGKTEGKTLVPVITTCKMNALNNPYLVWEKISEAKTYYIYQSTSKNRGYIEFKKINTLSEAITSCEKGKTYYFKIRAELNDGTFTDYSEPVSITIPPIVTSIKEQFSIAEPTDFIPEDAICVRDGGFYHYYAIYAVDSFCPWEQAEEYCESLGGHLATLTSSTQNIIAYSAAYLSKYDCVYFGLSDADQEGTWKWITGEPFNYSNWNDNEPGGKTKENYAAFYKKVDQYCWIDADFTENHEKAILCEWDVKKR